MEDKPDKTSNTDKIEKLRSIGEIKSQKKDEKDDDSQKNKKTKEHGSKTNDYEEKISELTDMLQRIQADFDNYRKKSEQDRSKYTRLGARDVIAQILPVIDSFEIALKNNEIDKERLLKGVELIYAQLYSVLEFQGLMPIEALGKKFDPYRHEVLMKQESDKDDDIVIDEFQKGYMLNDEVVRHSKVKISKKKEEKEKSGNETKQATK